VYIFLIAAYTFKYQGGPIVIGGSTNATESSILDKMRHAAMDQTVGQISDRWNSNFWCAPRYPTGIIICCEDVCGGDFAVYRFSFTLCLFFAAMTLLCAGTSKLGARTHRGFWFLKAFVVFALLVSTLFISNETLVGYREAARYLSVLFLLMQILLLIDFGYTLNEKMIERDDASEYDGVCGWKMAIIVLAGLMYLGCIVAWVLMYVYFGLPECPAQQTLISLTLLGSLALTAISCSKIAPHGTLLTSAVVTSYATYLCFSALSSHPDSSCNPFAHSASHFDGGGLLILVGSIGLTWSSATGGKEAMLGKSEDNLSQTEMAKPLDETGGANSSSAGNGGNDDDEEAVGAESWWYFHLMMAAVALYIAMLLTEFSSVPAEVNGVPLSRNDIEKWEANPPEWKAASMIATFWVKVGSQWACLLMYAWTLLAPYLLRESRDFGIEFDD
jgi:hypothetical protein